MSLSYSAITNHGKITLPSIESWSTNMSILKDPPKSITTRRVDKVGQTSDITAMIDNAGDRACEAILQYSRGINPSVSVQYNNSGNMSGKSIQGNNQQAFLPYRVARDGAFRPPIKTQYDLLHSHIDVLASLYFDDKPLSPTDLYDATIFSSGGMTKVLKKLEERELIKREASASDKRSMQPAVDLPGARR